MRKRVNDWLEQQIEELGNEDTSHFKWWYIFAAPRMTLIFVYIMFLHNIIGSLAKILPDDIHIKYVVWEQSQLQWAMRKMD